MVATICAIIKLICMFFKANLETNQRKRKVEKEALSEISAGIKEKDPSKITAGFNTLNNME